MGELYDSLHIYTERCGRKQCFALDTTDHLYCSNADPSPNPKEAFPSLAPQSFRNAEVCLPRAWRSALLLKKKKRGLSRARVRQHFFMHAGPPFRAAGGVPAERKDDGVFAAGGRGCRALPFAVRW